MNLNTDLKIKLKIQDIANQLLEISQRVGKIGEADLISSLDGSLSLLNMTVDELKSQRMPQDKKQFWDNNYSDLITWENFDKQFSWCRSCQDYSEEQCMCYTR